MNGPNFLRRNASTLRAIVLRERPKCVAAWVVGSSTIRVGESIADIDIDVFDPTVPLGQEESQPLQWQLPLSLQCFHPVHFAAVTKSEELTFFYLREIRKLRVGFPLVESQDSVYIRNTLSACRIPLRHLRPLSLAGTGFLPDQGRLPLLFAIENLAFAWTHLSWDYRYSKPKYLLDDIGLLPSDSFRRLMRAVSAEAAEADIEQSLDTLSRKCKLHSTFQKMGGRLHLRDANTLVRLGLRENAVWPLRMAAYAFANAVAVEHNVQYRDLRSIADLVDELGPADSSGRLLRHIVLLDSPIPAEQQRLYREACRDFVSEWNSRIAEQYSGDVGIRLPDAGVIEAL